MSEEEVLEAKRLRGAARQVFDTQRDMIKADLGAAGVGKRVATKLAEDGKIIAEEAADAASAHRDLLAIGALGLTAWFLRGPILSFTGRMLGFGNESDEAMAEEDAELDEAEAES